MPVIDAGTACDFSEFALQEAARKLGPSFVYEMRVSSRELLEARALLKRHLCSVVDNPLAPFVSLVEDASYKTFEWSLAANGKICWSSGA